MPNIDPQFPAKLRCLFMPKRHKVLYGGRGAGRSWGVARALLLKGCERPLRVLCARELQNSIAESVHRVLSDQIGKLGLEGLYRIEKTSIKGPSGTEFFFEGIRHNVDKIKSYEGIDVCWVEEANKVTQASWEVLLPTIRKDSSEIWITFNPELETDYTYQRFVLKPSPDSVVVKMTWADNPWFPPVLHSEMEDLRVRDYDAFLNVWEGHCRVVLNGAVYGNEIRAAIAGGRITNVLRDPVHAVSTFWDLGWADMTSIWFAQIIGYEYRIVDYYQNSQQKIDHYLGILQNRGYIYDTHWLPHDARAKQLGTGRSIEEMMRGKGFPVRIVPKLKLADGINAARTIFGNCWFDEERCQEGLKALRHYKYDIDKDDNQLSREPVHDWASHGADAFRYLALALREPKKKGNPQLGSKPRLSMEWAASMAGRAQSWMRD